ncbi:hypothetical protein, partial [uncultured Bradyrhizobium sp.]|uniref:hypothetical protein n=1 Tax=uncultured Bradyrhizobium sp. TaxID=199684 RepID=UPI00262B2474
PGPTELKPSKPWPENDAYLESAGVDKECVFAEHAVQLRHGRMIVRKHLGIELRHGLFDLSRIQLHPLLLRVGSGLDVGWFLPARALCRQGLESSNRSGTETFPNATH